MIIWVLIFCKLPGDYSICLKRCSGTSDSTKLPARAVRTVCTHVWKTLADKCLLESMPLLISQLQFIHWIREAGIRQTDEHTWNKLLICGHICGWRGIHVHSDFDACEHTYAANTSISASSKSEMKIFVSIRALVKALFQVRPPRPRAPPRLPPRLPPRPRPPPRLPPPRPPPPRLLPRLPLPPSRLPRCSFWRSHAACRASPAEPPPPSSAKL